MKICYSEPREPKQDFNDCECDEQTIDYHSNVNKPCAAVDKRLNLNNLTLDKARLSKAPNYQMIEQFVWDRKQITNFKLKMEINFGRFFKFVEFYSTSSLSKKLKSFKKSIQFNER
jgi:hypothetical protein